MQICNKTKQLGQEQEVGINDPASTYFYQQFVLKICLELGLLL